MVDGGGWRKGTSECGDLTGMTAVVEMKELVVIEMKERVVVEGEG